MERIVIIGLLAALWGVAWCQDGPEPPDPYQTATEPWIGPAPVPVMEQVFPGSN